jgi:GGDEF domain-containing protein
LGAALAAAKRFDESVAFLLIDLDHVAKFNAQCGRQAGDVALPSSTVESNLQWARTNP